MTDIIQLLPDSVANQIAAGEVIQRPASVVKELVENALDAGANEVHVMVVDAGRTIIQVIDNGSGMSATDARLSFERHATSKIRNAGDLFDLHTMGFRGEALASIAAVAQVTLITRTHEEEVGTQLRIEGSKFMEQQPVACPEGSQFKVENLFFNVPARRKFLKSNATELNNILIAYERIALVYPQVSFTLHSNGTELSNLPAAGLRQRIVDVFGKRINQDLLPINVDTTLCRITGYVGKPQSAKKKGAHQYFFVNSRYMKHAYFAKAVMAPFERLVPQGEQVPFFIYFDVPPADIDVNIHPTKTEIKFENEQAIWQILSASVKDAVGRFNDIPSIEFDTEDKPDIPVFGTGGTATMPRVRIDPQYNPFQKGETPRSRPSAEAGWQQMEEATKTDGISQQTTLFDGQEVDGTADIMAEKSPVHYQYKGRFIMTAVKSGLMIIDQHRAHLRVLFEEYLQKMASHKWPTQRVLFPEIVRLTPAETAVMQQLLDQLADVGFAVSDLGGGSFSINGVPAGLDGVDPGNMLAELIASAKDKTGRPQNEMAESVALGMARSSAIPYGQVLSNEEMENLVNRLFACSNVNLTPDGKSVTCILRQEEIEQLLG